MFKRSMYNVDNRIWSGVRALFRKGRHITHVNALGNIKGLGGALAGGSKSAFSETLVALG